MSNDSTTRARRPGREAMPVSAARTAWDIAHGHSSPLVAEAVRLGGAVQPPQPQTPQPPQQPQPQPQARPQPQPQQPPSPPKPPIPAGALDELATLAALGEMVAYRKRAEALAVEIARWVIAQEGCQQFGQLAADVAFLLDVSTETAKRYLRKHTSRWGALELRGDVVCIRGVGDGMG